MSVFWGVMGAVLLLLAAVGACLGYYARKLATPTKGAWIDLTQRPNVALVVIDVQKDFTRAPGKPAFAPELRERALTAINLELDAARYQDLEIAFIRNVFRDWPVIQMMKLFVGGMGTPGRAGLAFDRALKVGQAPVFEKSVGDTFSNPEFEGWLAQNRIGTLKLVGLDACHCVQLTAKGALSRGYRVEIHEPGTLTARPAKWPGIRQALEHSGVVFA